MPIIADITKLRTLDINAVARHPANARRPKRSPGLHLSHILQHLGLFMGMIQADDPTDIGAIDWHLPLGSPNLPLEALTRIAAGLAWEDWWGMANPHIDYHPGEFKLDGIAMSPDGLGYGGGDILSESDATILHECKFTWKSSRHAIEQQVLWFMQMKAYCKAIGTPWASLHVYHVNGNYSTNAPHYKVYSITFTQRELDDNWRMLTAYAIKNEKEIRETITQ